MSAATTKPRNTPAEERLWRDARKGAKNVWTLVGWALTPNSDACRDPDYFAGCFLDSLEKDLLAFEETHPEDGDVAREARQRLTNKVTVGRDVHARLLELKATSRARAKARRAARAKATADVAPAAPAHRERGPAKATTRANGAAPNGAVKTNATEGEA